MSFKEKMKKWKCIKAKRLIFIYFLHIFTNENKKY